MIDVRQFDDYDDEESLLISGQVTLPNDEKVPDEPAVRSDYPEPFDHQPMPGWVTAFVIVGTLGAMFALGTLIAK